MEKPIIRTPILFIAVAFVVVLLIWSPHLCIVKQMSMFPTLLNGDYVVIIGDTFLNTLDIGRGDIVIFKLEDGKGERDLAKRVIGIPGDKVELVNGVLLINGEFFPEYYVIFDYGEHESLSVEVPANHYFVMGDNKPYSYDSRSFGCISRERITGKIIWQ